MPNVETQTKVEVATDYTNAVISINGTSTGSASVSMQEVTLQAGTYTMCSKYISGSVNNAVQYIFKKKGASSNIGSFVWNDTNYQNNQKNTFTLDETTIIETSLWIGGASRIYTNFKTNVQLVKGSERDDNYEPYKTPKSYQFSLGEHKFYGIGTYRDYILRTTGKNLFDIADCRNNYTLGSDGIPTYNASQTRIANMTPIIVEGMEKVTITFTNYHNGAFMYSLLRADNSLITRTINQYSGTTITIGEAKYMYICFYDNATTENVKDVMLVEGSTASDYQPFGVGNWYKVGNIYERDETSIANNISSAVEITNTDYARITISFADGNYSVATPNGLCNYFKFLANYSSQSNHFYMQNHQAFIILEKTLLSTIDVAGAKSFFNSKPDLMLIYQLKSPTYTQITGTLAEQLEEWWNGQSLDGTTIIEGDGDLPMLINVRALKGAA